MAFTDSKSFPSSAGRNVAVLAVMKASFWDMINATAEFPKDLLHYHKVRELAQKTLKPLSLLNAQKSISKMGFPFETLLCTIIDKECKRQLLKLEIARASSSKKADLQQKAKDTATTIGAIFHAFNKHPLNPMIPKLDIVAQSLYKIPPEELKTSAMNVYVLSAQHVATALRETGLFKELVEGACDMLHFIDANAQNNHPYTPKDALMWLVSILDASILAARQTGASENHDRISAHRDAVSKVLSERFHVLVERKSPAKPQPKLSPQEQTLKELSTILEGTERRNPDALALSVTATLTKGLENSSLPLDIALKYCDVALKRCSEQEEAKQTSAQRQILAIKHQILTRLDRKDDAEECLVQMQSLPSSKFQSTVSKDLQTSSLPELMIA